MVFDTTDSKLSSFINEVQADDLTAIASLVFSRVASLETNEQERFVEQLLRDPQAKHVLERMQSYSQ